MAQIFRVERTKNFMVMSNHHFNGSSDAFYGTNARGEALAK